MNSKPLFQSRINRFMLNRTTDFKRIANGYMFLPLLLMMMGLYYYPLFIKWLPLSFPLITITCLILAVFETKGNYRSFIQIADLHYLISIEQKMSTYFQKTFLYNWILQSTSIVFVVMILSPLFLSRIDPSSLRLIIFIVILSLLKGWNLFIYWKTLKYRDKVIPWLFWYLRLFINYILLFGLLEKEFWMFIGGLVAAVFFSLNLTKNGTNKTIHWYKLLEDEGKLDARFNHFTSLFLDTDFTAANVFNRKGFTMFARLLPFSEKHAYHYLYVKCFFRNERFGMLIRMILIGMIGLSVIPDLYINIIFFLVFMFIIGLQMKTFWEYLSNQFWVYFYPLSRAYLKKAFIQSTFLIVILTGLLFSIVSILNNPSIMLGLFLLIINGIFTFIFCFVYLRIRIKV